MPAPGRWSTTISRRSSSRVTAAPWGTSRMAMPPRSVGVVGRARGEAVLARARSIEQLRPAARDFARMASTPIALTIS